MTAQRAAVVAAARSWIGTPYHNCADIKGVGVDCCMLLIRVYCDLGLMPLVDPRPYSPDWHLHRNEERYLEGVLERAKEVKAPDLGDTMLFRWGRTMSHGGIVTVTAPLTIVHAYAPARCVTEDEIARSAVLADRRRVPRFFSLWA